MSDKNLARRAAWQIWMQGMDTTQSVRPYFNSMTYTDNEADAADDLQIRLHDREGLWLQRWIGEAIETVTLPDDPIEEGAGEDAAGDAGGSKPVYWQDIAGGPGSAVGALDGQTETAPADTVYTVVKGDTLGRIAARYGTTWPKLAEYNNITTPNLIFPGQEIRIPGASSGSGALPAVATTPAAPASVRAEAVPTPIAASLPVTPTAQAAPAQTAPERDIRGFAIEAAISRLNWEGDGADKVLECGEFELDDVDYSGPPGTVTLKATSLPFTSNIRQTKKSKAWESYRLSGIAREMAALNGMECMFLSVSDPFFERVEQRDESDSTFLASLCRRTGISLKVTNHLIVLFDQADYESRPEVTVFDRLDRRVLKYRLHAGTADTQYASCRVSCVDPEGRCIEGIAYVEDYDAEAKNNQQLEITAKVGTAAEAQLQAEKMLRLHNKYARTAVFTVPGDPDLVSGVTVKLAGWGAWDGKYIVSQAKHTVGEGYTTQLTMRKVLEGY